MALKPIAPIEAVVQKLAVDAINVVIWAQADEALFDVVGRELPKLFPERVGVAPAIDHSHDGRQVRSISSLDL